MEREKPVTGEVYHVYNRGVDKRDIFISDRDRVRFVHDLWEFNDRKPANNIERTLSNRGLADHMVEDRLRPSGLRKREKLVEILAWCLMPNHFHLMLRQLVEYGIPTFMRKLGTGYVNAFNLVRKRVGPLFQGVYQFKHVNNESHFLYLPHYIHLNPLDLVPKGNKGNHDKALNFIDSYRWSSLQDYCGKKNIPSIIESDFIISIFKSPGRYRKEFLEWMEDGDDAIIDSILFD